MLESILRAIAGGALIGFSASFLLLVVGRVAGISGIMGGLLRNEAGDRGWRLSFLLGMVAGGLMLLALSPASFHVPTGRPLLVIGAAGLLVGFGTRLGNGCTSGHGVCGLTRFSRRSMVATATFMLTGFLTATAYGMLAGGAG